MLDPAWIVRCLLSVGLTLTAIDSALGVVVSTTRTTDQMPADDFGWSNVGLARGSTAIYLGNRWVLGAAHVGVGAVTFDGLGSFEADPSTRIQITNPPGYGLTRPADLILYQLTQDPGLPPLEVARDIPTVGDEVWIAGRGIDAAADRTHWDVTQRGSNWIWTEVSSPGEYSGYKTNGSAGTLRWGTNLIEDDETFGNDFDDDILAKLVDSSTQTLTLLTEFDDDDSKSNDSVRSELGSSATGYESQAVLHDSGGGMFQKVDGRWQLVGTILSVEGHRDQPDVRRNAMFGNLTYYASLPSYADQIVSQVVFGDFDEDRSLSVADVDALIRAINDHSGVDLRYDLNRDGQLTAADLDRWVVDIFGTFAGDSNLDGQFSTSDLILVLQAGIYEDGIAGNGSWAAGDWDGDLDVTSRDFVVALRAGGFEAGPRTAAAAGARAAAVPEPSAWFLAVLSGIAAAGCWRRRRRSTS
jgi:hypothetical protein